mmetsp:Transcript_4243/g.5600  ORF Transcript_4243/g.5600 Transcript_4243/m.5600 type:complete len:580 (+) Transcript_4243:38-1777(+)
MSASDFDEGLATLKSQSSISSDLISQLLISSQNRLPELNQLLDILDDRNISDEVFCKAVFETMKIELQKKVQNQIPELFHILKKRKELDGYCFGVTIVGYGWRNDWKNAIETFFEMKCAGPNLVVDPTLFRWISSACESENKTMREENRKNALILLRSLMETSGMSPGPIWDQASISAFWERNVLSFYMNLTLNNQFKVLINVDDGQHARVFKVQDSETNKFSAIKIVELGCVHREIGLLEMVRDTKGFEDSNIVELKSWFTNQQVLKRPCMVFDYYPSTLSNYQDRFFPLHLIRKIAQQLLISFQFLAQPELKVMYTDLKLDNICIEASSNDFEDCFINENSPCQLKLIDFGSAYQEKAYINHKIQPPTYRSPEVLFGDEFTVAMDIWSLGCVLIELYTDRLFGADTDISHINEMISVVGCPPDSLINKLSPEIRNQVFVQATTTETVSSSLSSSLSSFFVSSTSQDVLKVEAGAAVKVEAAEDAEEVSPKMWSPIQKPQNTVSIAELLISKRQKLRTDIFKFKSMTKGVIEDEDSEECAHFHDLISKMLVYDVKDRITPTEALNHPFMTSPELQVFS